MVSLSLFFLKQLRAMVIEEKISGRKKSAFSLSLCRSSSKRKRKRKREEKVTATKARAC
jgi:hypothetical protein